MRHLNLDQLQAFVQVAETGSFSAAAQRLNLTQPAISMQVRQLEQRLGLPLLERLGRRVTPTAAGHDLMAHARKIEAVVDSALAAMAVHAGGTVGRVRLATGATACIYLLPPVLRDLRARLPGLEILVSTGNTPDILRALEDNQLDLALVTLPVAGRAFEVVPLLEDGFVAIASSSAPPLPETVMPQDLAGRPLVLYEPGANTRHLIDDWFRGAGLTPRPVMELGSAEAIKRLVGAGLGYSMLPRTAVDGEGADALRQHSLAPPLNRQLGLVRRRDKAVDTALGETIRALESLAAYRLT
ncbi:MAG: LysR family transcriptional regulator [Alphaproteobacteria bacterium]